MASEPAQAELPPILEPVEHALNDVACFVDLCVVFKLYFAVSTRRNAGGCFGSCQLFAQVIGVVSLIRDDGAAFSNISLKTLFCMRYIRAVARSQCQMHGASTTIADQMQFAVQPAFDLADSAPVRCVFLTPLAAIRWVLM